MGQIWICCRHYVRESDHTDDNRKHRHPFIPITHGIASARSEKFGVAIVRPPRLRPAGVVRAKF